MNTSDKYCFCVKIYLENPCVRMHLTASDMRSLLNTVANRFHDAGKKIVKRRNSRSESCVAFSRKKLPKKKYVNKSIYRKITKKINCELWRQSAWKCI